MFPSKWQGRCELWTQVLSQMTSLAKFKSIFILPWGLYRSSYIQWRKNWGYKRWSWQRELLWQIYVKCFLNILHCVNKGRKWHMYSSKLSRLTNTTATQMLRVREWELCALCHLLKSLLTPVNKHYIRKWPALYYISFNKIIFMPEHCAHPSTHPLKVAVSLCDIYSVYFQVSIPSFTFKK